MRMVLRSWPLNQSFLPVDTLNVRKWVTHRATSYITDIESLASREAVDRQTSPEEVVDRQASLEEGVDRPASLICCREFHD